ncbi:MAG: FIST N-terminal domain-containing protein [Bacillota bacterium]
MKAGVGTSKNPIARMAGIEAAAEALSRSGSANLTILYTTDNYKASSVLEGVKTIVGDSCVVGACGAGLFTASEVIGQGVGVLTLAADEKRVKTALVQHNDADDWDSGVKLGQELLSTGIEQGTVFCYPDGFTGNITNVLLGLHDAIGINFTIIGGGTGDNLKFRQTCQMNEGGVVSNAVSAAVLSDCTMSVGVVHGWEPMDQSPLIVTRSNGRIVHEFDGRPAFKVYSDKLGCIDRENFSEVAMRYPLGITSYENQYIIRDPLLAHEDGAIQFITEIPGQSVAYIMKPVEDKDHIRAKNLSGSLLASVGQPVFALVFYCVSLSLLKGEGFIEEINSLMKPLGSDLPVLGFLAFGEIGSSFTMPYFHNKSICLGIGGRRCV